MTLRTVIHSTRENAKWKAKASAFAGVTTLELTIGRDEVVIFVRPDQGTAARVVADVINAAFGSDLAKPPGIA